MSARSSVPTALLPLVMISTASHSSALPPVLDSEATSVPIEREVLSGAELRDVHDLARVHAEVLDHVVDGTEHVRVPSLDLPILGEHPGIEGAEHAVRVAQRRF